MKHINIKHLSNLHNDWLRGLEFYSQELQILQERLDEIAAANTADEVLQQVEHFQNQLIIHNSYIDNLKREINANLHSIGVEVQEFAGFVEETEVTDHEKLQELYDTEEKMIKDLRREFYDFAARWL